MGKFATSKNGNIASGTEVLANNMVFLQQTKEDAISNLFGDLFIEGILSGFEISTNANGTFNIDVGIAYKQNANTGLYNRIAILDTAIYHNEQFGDTTYPDGMGVYQKTATGVGDEYIDTPKSTGCLNIPIPTANTQYYIDLRYMLVCDNGNEGDGLNLINYSIAKDSSSTTIQRKRFYKWIDGYEIKLIATNSLSDTVQGICLGTISKDNNNEITIDLDSRTSKLILKNDLIPDLYQWGNITGNIYEQEDLWEIILSGGLDSKRTWADNIGGYPKGTIIRFYEKNGSYLVSSLVDNNMDEPNINNIQYRDTDTGKTWKCMERTIIDTKKEGTRWYRLYSDRWCEQGDRVENTSTSVNSFVNITFPLAFEDTNYNIHLDPWGVWGSGSNDVRIGITNPAINGADIIFYSAASGFNPEYIQWEAKGYISQTTYVELLNISDIRNGSNRVEQIGSDIIVNANDRLQIIMAGAGVSGSGGGMLNCVHTFTEATTLRLKRINGRSNRSSQIGLVLFTYDGEDETPILAVGGRGYQVGEDWNSEGGSGYIGGIGFRLRGWSYDGTEGNSTVQKEGACGDRNGTGCGGQGYVDPNLADDTQTVYGSSTSGNGTYAYARIYRIE